MKITRLSSIITLPLLSFFAATPVSAQGTGSTTTDVFGTVSPPPGVDKYNALAGGGDAIGLLIFISRMIRLGTVAAGIWVLLNLVLAGYDYITANGDSGAHKKVKDKVTMSVMGLLVIVASYTVMGILGFVLFGKADFFLNPEISGPG